MTLPKGGGFRRGFFPRPPTMEPAVVFTVTVAVTGVELLGLTEAGEVEQVTPVGRGTNPPLQLSATDWLKPLVGVRVSV